MEELCRKNNRESLGEGASPSYYMEKSKPVDEKLRKCKKAHGTVHVIWACFPRKVGR